VSLYKMLVYWITYVVTGVVLEWTPLGWLIPAIWSVRTIGLAGILSPKTDWKSIIYNIGFEGAQPEAEKVIMIGKETVKKAVKWLKECE